VSEWVRNEESVFLNKENWSSIVAPRVFIFSRINLIHLSLFVVGQVLEFIREGKSVAELMDLGKQLLGR
jgi:hypothetical protein